MTIFFNADEFHACTNGEQSWLKYQYRFAGGFETKLWDAIIKADQRNLDRLAKGFPSHIQAPHDHRALPDWWDELRDRVVRRPKDIEAEKS